MFICGSNVMPLPIFSGLRIKIPNLYHMPAFSVESVREKTCAAVVGKGESRARHRRALSSSIWGNLCSLSTCCCGQHQKLDPHVAQLTVYCSVTAGGTVYLMLFRMMFLYRHLHIKDLFYHKHLALETNCLEWIAFLLKE